MQKHRGLVNYGVYTPSRKLLAVIQAGSMAVACHRVEEIRGVLGASVPQVYYVEEYTSDWVDVPWFSDAAFIGVEWQGLLDSGPN